jgi:hypothetical protein
MSLLPISFRSYLHQCLGRFPLLTKFNGIYAEQMQHLCIWQNNFWPILPIAAAVEAVEVKPILCRNPSNFSKLWYLLPLLPLLREVDGGGRTRTF